MRLVGKPLSNTPPTPRSKEQALGKLLGSFDVFFSDFNLKKVVVKDENL